MYTIIDYSIQIKSLACKSLLIAVSEDKRPTDMLCCGLTALQIRCAKNSQTDTQCCKPIRYVAG
jgi:hypothetical protein